MTTGLEVPGRALAIGAHPDDIELQAGATLARWAAHGCEVHFLVLTDGSKGSWAPDDDRDALVALRRREALEAAGELGARDVHFLGLVDGELQSGLVERALVSRVIRAVAPDVVLGHDPWKRYRLHPDHRHAGFLTVDGVVAAREPRYRPHDGPAHRPSALLLFEADDPDHVEDAGGFVEVKVASLLRHRSQWRTTMGIGDRPDDERAEFVARLHREAAEAGRLAGLAYGEAFRRIEGL